MRNEHDLGSRVVQLARELGWMVLDLRFHGRLKGGYGPAAQAIKGWPDLILFGRHAASPVLLELKWGAAKLRPDQTTVLEALAARRYDVLILRAKSEKRAELCATCGEVMYAGTVRDCVREALSPL